MQISRYEVYSEGYPNTDTHVEQCTIGDWVKYEEHELVVNALHKRIRELESKIVQLNDIIEFDLDDYK